MGWRGVFAALSLMGVCVTATWKGFNPQEESTSNYGPRVYLIDMEEDHQPECTTEMHRRIMVEVRRRSEFHPEKAEFVFVNVDTLFQVLWPSRNRHENQRCEGSENIHYWSQDNDYRYYEALVAFRNKYPKYMEGKKFVYFWNVNLKRRKQLIHDRYKEFDMIYVGLDNTVSNDNTTEINLIQPLFPDMLPHASSTQKTMEERSVLASFRGSPSAEVRDRLFKLQAPEGVKLDINRYTSWVVRNEDSPLVGSYKDILANSKFGFSPRGEQHYSFRTAEILAQGAIPVILDDAVAPIYGTNMSTWAVHMKEADVDNAVDILRNIPTSQLDSLQESGKWVLGCAMNMHNFVLCMLKALQATKDEMA